MNYIGLPEEQKVELGVEKTYVSTGKDLSDWESSFAQVVPNVYAATKTVSSFVPYMWTLFPSGREEFSDLGAGGKAITLGIDTVSLVPAALLFKGTKSLLQSGKVGSWLAGKVGKPLKSLSVVEETIPIGSKWESIPIIEKIKSQWKIPVDEAQALLEGNAKPVLWKQVLGPSGAFIPRKPTPNFSKLFKKGQVNPKITEQITKWQTTPLVQQRKEYYTELWKTKIKDMSNGGEPNFDNMFNYQVERFFGVKKAEGFSLKNASSKVMANLFLDTIDHPTKILKQLDIGYHWIIPTIFLPSRKAMGGGERMFGTYSMFERLKDKFRDVNEYAMQQYTNFVSLLADRGFGQLVKIKYGGKEIISGFKRDKEFTKEVWEEYGKTAVEMDRMRSSGATDLDVSNFLRNKPEIVQRLMTEIHKPFHDDLYKDYVLTRIPQIFMDRGLSEEGFKSFSILWEGENSNGIAKTLASFLDSNADLEAKEVMSRVGAGLDLLKSKITGSWFSETDGTKLKQLMDDVIEDLTFSTKDKVGFAGYLDNYAIRISKDAESLTNKRISLTGAGGHAGFVKTRLLEEHNELVSDPMRLIQARVNQQAKEIWLKPYLDKELKGIAKFPEGYKLYFDYWLGRMLGQPTAVDAKVAQWLTTTMGGLAKLFHKDPVWTSKRVHELAYKINDIVYKGALSFRPFAAVRNSFQPMLTVPTDMGGIKDTYWLARGYVRGLKPETQAYMQSKGMIGDYLEELKPSNILPQFNMKILGKEMPATKEFWDAGMWLFKGSDRFSRYVAGGAALEKWDHYVKKYLSPTNYQPKLFAKKMNIHLREDWVRRQIEGVLDKLPKQPTSQLDIDYIANEAKDKFVSDIVADTQWLYGVPDAPQITGKFGIISKTGAIFQTWWMNYITQLVSWFLRRGTPGDKLDRFFTWIVSSAVAGELMVHVAGFRGSQARATILGGPMPTEVSPMLIPPTWAPFYYALSSVAELAKLSPDLAKQRIKSLGRSLTLGIPGGIITGQAIRGYKQDEWEGLSRAIFNYYGGTGETLLKQ